MKTIQDHQIDGVYVNAEYGKEFVDLADMDPLTRRQFARYLRGKHRPDVPGYQSTAWAKDWHMWLGYRQGKRAKR